MKASMQFHPHFQVGKIDDRLYGAFLEHMGRAVYHGIYEPGHPEADERGFRKDVIRMVKDLRVSLIRYPGGNFVSNYRWEDGVGPVEQRPRTTDAAWQSVEPNLVGTDEFHQWAEAVGSRVMMAVNLGTRGPEDAKNLLEYCNFPAGSRYADWRIRNGRREPYNDRVWCLGNEMDGDWQVGQRTPEDYADIARKTALVMKRMDPSLELVACGSANYYMPTFGRWEAAVLEAAYDSIDYLSLHQYYINEEQDTASYLGATQDMNRFIRAVTATCDYVRGLKRSSKEIHLSFDEWNVWSATHKCDNEEGLWTVAPRREEYLYSMEDALVFGCMLITLLKNCDRVKIACLAQLVNVAGPIMTLDDGPAWAQTTYYPFLHASRYGRGTALQPSVQCDTYETAKYGTVPYVEAVAVLSDDNRSLTVFAVNRSLEEQTELELDLRDFPGFGVREHLVLESDDIHACNTAEEPFRVVPHTGGRTAVKGDKATSVLNPLSWNVIRLVKE